MNIVIVGHARHGKDTVSSLLAQKTNLVFQNTSMLLCKKVIYPLLKNMYSSLEDCYNDRGNNRIFWFVALQHYNKFNKDKFIKNVFTVSNIYCGLRNIEELNIARQANLIDYVIWVDRSKHLSLESVNSMTIKESDTDYHIDNNGSLIELENMIDKVIIDLKISNKLNIVL